ncbi:HNH/endonuclease VII fold putative polymorphic toxin [Paraburkholderia tropica]|uniref:HNH/endonuclease VII fold putative polymorphic toxin n=1 Tax=Paraburkholderia tropica TaxID=92647 RepID=UPI002ABE65F0|nr:HNH/endonuclease VII fold putative polymorphic toxin [Paraburkholderia tropica]
MAGTLNDISKGVASATGSELIGNLAANIAAGVGGAALGGTAGAAMGSNVHLYNQTVDDERALTGESGRKTLTLADYFMAGVKTALDLLPFGFGGGRPPAAGPGAVLVNGAGQALAAGISSSSTAAGYGPSTATFAKDDNGSAPPPNMSPEGAGRSGAFNEAKRNTGVPVSQQPSEVRPNVDRRGNPQPGYQYDFEIPQQGGGTKTVTIRDDAAGHSFGEGNAQNRGPHFNDPKHNHYDY